MPSLMLIALHALVLNASPMPYSPSNNAPSVRAELGALPEFEAAVRSERGQINTRLSGLIAMPNPIGQLSDFVKVTKEELTIQNDTSTPFNDTNNGTQLRLITINDVGGQFWVGARAAFGRNLNLYLGLDANNDGVATNNEVLCHKDSSADMESCHIDVNIAGRYWLLLQIANPSNTPYRNVTLDYAAIPPVTLPRVRANYVAMPGKTRAGEEFPITLAFDIDAGRPVDQFIATMALRADRAATSPTSTTVVRLYRDVGGNMPIILQNQRLEDILLGSGNLRTKISFSVPANATSANISITNSTTGRTEYRAEIVRAAANETMLEGVAAYLPALRSASFSNGVANMTLSGNELTPGRYYLRLHNSYLTVTSNAPPPVNIKVNLNITTTDNAPGLAPELYYNPARSGHGLIVTRAGPDAQFIWYTYDHNGQPTWYLFMPTGYYANNPGIMSGPLLRSTWDGSKGSGGDVVGNATITRTGTNEFIFDFSVLGMTGSEPMKFLGASGCISGNNVSTPTDFTGLWYQPSSSGWGASVHIAPGFEFVPFFIYDELGQPRWVLGTHSAPTLANSAPATNSLSQLSGFCPTCSYTAVTQRPAGSYSLKMDAIPRLAADITGTVTLNAVFQTPLVGSFTQSGDFALLTGKKSCVQ